MQFKAQGIKPYWCLLQGVTVSMYDADPDGTPMQFQVDSHAFNAETSAFTGGGCTLPPIGSASNTIPKAG